MDSNTDLAARYETMKYILSISYDQLERYDSKTNQLLSLIGLDFTVLGIFCSFIYTSQLSMLIKIIFISLSAVDMLLIIISLFSLRNTLSPHLTPVNHKPKAKRGMLFFKDVLSAFSQEEYVATVFGEQNVAASRYYAADDPDSFLKCLLEDCARDVYEQAQILDLKSTNIKAAFRLVVWSTVLTLATVVVTSALFLIGV